MRRYGGDLGAAGREAQSVVYRECEAAARTGGTGAGLRDEGGAAGDGMNAEFGGRVVQLVSGCDAGG